MFTNLLLIVFKEKTELYIVSLFSPWTWQHWIMLGWPKIGQDQLVENHPVILTVGSWKLQDPVKSAGATCNIDIAIHDLCRFHSQLSWSHTTTYDRTELASSWVKRVIYPYEMENWSRFSWVDDIKVSFYLVSIFGHAEHPSPIRKIHWAIHKRYGKSHENLTMTLRLKLGDLAARSAGCHWRLVEESMLMERQKRPRQKNKQRVHWQYWCK